MTEPLPRVEADALRECLRILAGRYSPERMKQPALNVASCIECGRWPAFSALDIAMLFYPDDSKREGEFLEKIKRAIASGELHPWGDAFVREVLITWPACDPVPSNSPLRYWLPESMHEKVSTDDMARIESPKRKKLRELIRLADLDPTNMPGEKIDFHALAATWDRDFRVALSTFAGHIKGDRPHKPLCTFKKGNGRAPESYRAKCSGVGVKTEDYNRVLSDLERQAERAREAKATRGS